MTTATLTVQGLLTDLEFVRAVANGIPKGLEVAKGKLPGGVWPAEMRVLYTLAFGAYGLLDNTLGTIDFDPEDEPGLTAGLLTRLGYADHSGKTNLPQLDDALLHQLRVSLHLCHLIAHQAQSNAALLPARWVSESCDGSSTTALTKVTYILRRLAHEYPAAIDEILLSRSMGETVA